MMFVSSMHHLAVSRQYAAHLTVWWDLSPLHKGEVLAKHLEAHVLGQAYGGVPSFC